MQNYICSQNFLLNQGPQLRIRGEEEKLQRFSIGNSLILPSQNEKYSNTTIQGKWMVQIYEYDHCRKKSYSQVIFDKDTENTQWKKMVSSINGAGKTGQPHAKKWNWTPVLYQSKN